MARRPYRQTNLPVAALGLAAVGLGAAALGLGNGDVFVERGFTNAFASMADRASQGKGADVITSAGEQLRVTRAAHDPSAVFAKPLAVGDRITIASGGHERTLHVVKVDQLDSAIVPASSGHPAPLLLVTCQDEANAKARPVRFLIESDETLPALSTTTAARIL
jgi:hypothetical protein